MKNGFAVFWCDGFMLQNKALIATFPSKEEADQCALRLNQYKPNPHGEYRAIAL